MLLILHVLMQTPIIFANVSFLDLSSAKTTNFAKMYGHVDVRVAIFEASPICILSSTRKHQRSRPATPAHYLQFLTCYYNKGEFGSCPCELMEYDVRAHGTKIQSRRVPHESTIIQCSTQRYHLGV